MLIHLELLNASVIAKMVEHWTVFRDHNIGTNKAAAGR
jgi:hypothetical protein